MKLTLLLIRMILKNSLSGLNPLKKSGGKGKNTVMSVFILACLLFALGSVIYLEYEIYGILKGAHQEALLPAMACLLAMMMSLLMGLFQTMTELYQGRDVSWLAVLPVSSGQIYAAKLFSLYVSDLVLNIPIVLPAAVMYLIGQPDWVLPALRLIPVFLCLPVLPLAIVALIAHLLMRLGGFARHRDKAVTVLSILFMGAYMLVVSSISARTASEEGAAQALSKMLTTENGLLNQVSRAFPPVRWAALGFTESFGMMLLFCAVSAAGIVLCFLLTYRNYLPTALAAGEQTKTGARGKQRAVSGRASSPLRALMKLEWHDLLRCQSYLLNGVLGGLIMPVALMIGGFGGLSQVKVPKEEIAQDLSGAVKSVPAALLIAIITAVLFLCCMVNQLPATAISREGRHYPFALSLPVTQKQRLSAKLLVSLEINVISMLIMLIPAMILLPVPPLYMLAGFVMALMLSVFPAAVSMVIDARHPKLNWMSETDALKKNFNSFFCIVLWVVAAAVTAITAFLLSRVSPAAMLIGLAACAVILCAGSLWFLNRAADQCNTLPED